MRRVTHFLLRHAHGLLFVSLLIIALLQLGQGLWVFSKAKLAQYLIAESWQISLDLQQPNKPWPWADTWPVARLQWPEENIDLYVLAGAHGSSLAFGPGHVLNSGLPQGEQSQGSIISGHRDTHFKFLSKVKPGHKIRLQTMDGRWHNYQITSHRIDNIKKDRLVIQPGLQLVTCYPFDALRAGGDLRYVVSAEKLTAEASFGK